jgi:hypothetical protein
MASEKLCEFCECLLKIEVDSPFKTNGDLGGTEPTLAPSQSEEPTFFREDVENLSHFTQIWTDVIDKGGEAPLQTPSFKREGLRGDCDPHGGVMEGLCHPTLIDVGFFTVQINPETPILEFFHLLTRIPWPNLCLPGLDQIPYHTIAQLFNDPSHKIAIQLMVLGDFFHFWQLVHPYQRMLNTSSTTKLLLSGMGNMTIRIVPNFIQNCQEMIETLDMGDEAPL